MFFQEARVQLYEREKKENPLGFLFLLLWENEVQTKSCRILWKENSRRMHIATAYAKNARSKLTYNG